MKTIFLVDDNDTNRMVAKEALQKDYQVYSIASANRMFNMLEKVVPDLFLLDIDMPGMDGMAALMQMKADDKLKAIPVIMLSAHGQSEVVTDCIRLGAQGFVVKPFEADHLRETVIKTIGKPLL